MRAVSSRSPPDRPFLDDAGRGLVAMAGGDPLALARMTVLLPTRRAARACARRSCAPARRRPAPLLLPRMRRSAISTPRNWRSPATRRGAARHPPAVPELRRRLLLTRLVLHGARRTATGAVARPGGAARRRARAASRRRRRPKARASTDLAKLVPRRPRRALAEWCCAFSTSCAAIGRKCSPPSGCARSAERRNRVLAAQAAAGAAPRRAIR